jgi:hypothetical protein
VPSHGELLKMMAGVNMVHVPYRGEAACTHRFARGTGAGDVSDRNWVNPVHPSRRARKGAEK